MSHGQKYIIELRQRGYRITPQREMIIKALAHNEKHQTADVIFTQVQARTQALNIATVYRTLDWLVEQGLVSRCDLGGGQEVYSTLQHGSHIHLVCRQCGVVLNADYQLAASLQEQLQSEYQFNADLQHLAVPGLCAVCQTEAGR